MQPARPASFNTTRLLCCFLLVSFLRGVGKELIRMGGFFFSLCLWE